MPTMREGQTYYRTLEVCRTAGISRATLLRWIGQGVVQEATFKDRLGWRLFSEDDVNTIECEANKMSPQPRPFNKKRESDEDRRRNLLGSVK